MASRKVATTKRGSRSRKVATTKRGSRNNLMTSLSPGLSPVSEPMYQFKGEIVKYTSSPGKGHHFGERTTINVKNGRGVKRHEILNKSGKALKSHVEKFEPPHLQPTPRIVIIRRAL